jgi:hypothetical protein
MVEKNKDVKKLTIIMLAGLFGFSQFGNVLAQPYSSTNYQIDESFIGPGGFIDASSNNYSARASLGDTGIGNSASANYQLYGGYTTTDEEYLEIYVTGDTIDLGVLSASAASTTNGYFYVRSYLSTGYSVTTASEPPTSEGGSQLDPMTAGGTSSPGTEQFGINLVANTAPSSFGADPVQVPDNTFSFGYAASGYDTANNFRYNAGDVIAQADSSSGRTDYTISYLYNINNATTPAGVYRINHTIVATATF